MAKGKPRRCGGPVYNATSTRVGGQGHKGHVLQRLQLDFFHTSQLVLLWQHDEEGFGAEALRNEWLRHVRDIAHPKICHAAANIILDVALNAFSQIDLNSRELPLVSCDDLRQRDMGQRHDASYNDLPALLGGEFAHVLDADF